MKRGYVGRHRGWLWLPGDPRAGLWPVCVSGGCEVQVRQHTQTLCEWWSAEEIESVIGDKVNACSAVLDRFSLCWPQMWYHLATLCTKLGTGSRLQVTFDWMVPLVKPASGSLGSRSYFSLVKNPEKLTWRFNENLKGQKKDKARERGSWIPKPLSILKWEWGRTLSGHPPLPPALLPTTQEGQNYYRGVVAGSWLWGVWRHILLPVWCVTKVHVLYCFFCLQFFFKNNILI